MKKIIIIIAVVLVVVVGYLVISKLVSQNKTTVNENGNNKNSNIITEFALTESSSNDMADRESKKYKFLLDANALEIETPKLGKRIKIELNEKERNNFEQELMSLIENHSLKKWNGYDESVDVLDNFHSFTLNVEYADGKEIYAKGEHMFPDDYKVVFKDVQTLFLNYKK